MREGDPYGSTCNLMRRTNSQKHLLMVTRRREGTRGILTPPLNLHSSTFDPRPTTIVTTQATTTTTAGTSAYDHDIVASIIHGGCDFPWTQIHQTFLIIRQVNNGIGFYMRIGLYLHGVINSSLNSRALQWDSTRWSTVSYNHRLNELSPPHPA